MIPGEAAGAIVLSGVSTFRGLQPLATVSRIGTAVETRLIKTDDEILGEGLSAAIAQVVSDRQLPAEAVDAIFCDINGERYRTDEWGFAVLRLGRALRASGYDAPSDCWGDVGAATAALGCVLAAQSWVRGYAKGPRALIWAGSESGLRGAALLERPAA
jgi:3-oxoacyl-[acyl-carrier-protein] synthase-1